MFGPGGSLGVSIGGLFSGFLTERLGESAGPTASGMGSRLVDLASSDILDGANVGYVGVAKSKALLIHEDQRQRLIENQSERELLRCRYYLGS